MTPHRKNLTAGRPPKFDEPSSPITVTLPHRILLQLEQLDNDRGKAIVKCVEALAEDALTDDKQVEVVRMSESAGLIVIGPCQSLKSIPWLHLIEISPARFLLSVPTGTAVATLELAILDVIEKLPPEEASDKRLLEKLRQQLAHHRRLDVVTKAEILFIDI